MEDTVPDFDFAFDVTLSYPMSMTNRASKPVTVTLGAMSAQAQAHVASGRYASVSEVVRAGLRALEREERALDDLIKARVEAALADPAPSLAQDEVFDQLRTHHAARANG